MADRNPGDVDLMGDFPNWRDYVTDLTGLDEGTQKRWARERKQHEDALARERERREDVERENEDIKGASIGYKGRLPELEKSQSGSASSASSGLLSSHEETAASFEEFPLEDDSDLTPNGHATRTWTELNDDGKLTWSNESMIARFVHNVLMDIIITLGIKNVSIQSEMHFRGQRPDKYLLYQNTKPIGAVEVKIPRVDAKHHRSADGYFPLGESTDKADPMANKNVQGQVLDYLRLLKNYYGILDPFCILTSFEEWRVFWLSDLEREETLANASEEAPKRHMWPNILTELERDTHEHQSLSPKRRDVRCSRIYSTNHPTLLKFIASVVKKMVQAEIRPPEFNDLKRTVVKVGRHGWTWQILGSTPPFSWNFCVPPPDKKEPNYFLLTPLGAGAEGRVWLACRDDKSIFAIKFKHPRKEERGTRSREAIRQEQNERMDREALCWRMSQGNIGKNARTEQIDGCLALLMPFLPQQLGDPSAAQKEAAKRAVESFGLKGFHHKDLSWRHIAYYGNDANHPEAALLDLGYVTHINQTRSSCAAAIDEMKQDLRLNEEL